MGRKRKLINKKHFKSIQSSCKICNDDNKAILDVHRILEGANGGEYTRWNSICLCSNCHRKVHAGQIKILGHKRSTNGLLVEIKNDDGEVKYI